MRLSSKASERPRAASPLVRTAVSNDAAAGLRLLYNRTVAHSKLVVQPLALPPGPAEGDDLGGGRLAAIDIGSNSIHMIVVAPEPNGGYRVLGREREMVRLGKSALGSRRTLSDLAIADGLEALIKMTTLASLKGAGTVVAVATSAVREAANGQEFIDRIKAQTGIDVQLLSGDEEGRLIYRAVREVVDLGPELGAIVDVGGGSTEWVTTRASEIDTVVSLTLGSLRCAPRLNGDPPTEASIEKMRRELETHIGAEIPRQTYGRLVTTSGTATCCADLIDFFAGRKATTGSLREVRTKDLAQLIERIRPVKRSLLAELPPVGGPRSESLIAGAVLLHTLVVHAGVDKFQVCDRALREGLVLAALGQPIPIATEPEDLRRRQVLQLAHRAGGVVRHSLQSARLAVRIFDLTASLHGLGNREREWLEYAALLHDIGYSVHYRAHHKHTFYLVANATLDAFDRHEVEIIAHVARYHRGATPRAKHAALRALKPWQQTTIRQLATLLRLADALDRTHASRVEEIFAAITPKRVRIEVLSQYDVQLELEEARTQAPLFERVFERRLTLRQGLETAAE
jgi:exopolyphosphatase/guanosine-5'-triphosphate,3'-diphosphate pyrophosphatase